MDNYETANKIIKMLGTDKTGILNGLMAACADCDRLGPRDGKPCMALRMALDNGVEYTPPKWCKDKQKTPN